MGGRIDSNGRVTEVVGRRTVYQMGCVLRTIRTDEITKLWSYFCFYNPLVGLLLAEGNKFCELHNMYHISVLMINVMKSTGD